MIVIVVDGAVVPDERVGRASWRARPARGRSRRVPRGVEADGVVSVRAPTWPTNGSRSASHRPTGRAAAVDRTHARRRAVGGGHARTAQPHRRLVVPRPRHDRSDRCGGGRRGQSPVRVARRREPRRVGGRVRDRRRGGRRHRADAGRVRRLLRGAHEVVGRPALGGHPDRSDAGAARRPVRAGLVRHHARRVVAALGPPARCADPRPADRARHHRAAHRRGPGGVVARRRRDRGRAPWRSGCCSSGSPAPRAGRRTTLGRWSGRPRRRGADGSSPPAGCWPSSPSPRRCSGRNCRSPSRGNGSTCATGSFPRGIRWRCRARSCR